MGENCLSVLFSLIKNAAWRFTHSTSEEEQRNSISVRTFIPDWRNKGISSPSRTLPLKATEKKM